MWWGAVDETNERAQFDCNSIIVVQRRIERKSVLVTNRQSESVSLLHPVKRDADVEGLCANAGQVAKRDGEQRWVDINASGHARIGEGIPIAADG
jgi:Tfp pilus assembly protein FimT